MKAIRVAQNGKALGSVTISLGIAACPGQGTRGLDLIGAAYGALYQAEHEGRDCVVAAASLNPSGCDRSLMPELLPPSNEIAVTTP